MASARTGPRRSWMRSSRVRTFPSRHARGRSTYGLPTTNLFLRTSTFNVEAWSPSPTLPLTGEGVAELARGLVIMHIDGLGADSLEQALRDGDMPFTRRLIDAEGYTVQRYRCGVPSTTPFAQAGIIYGDNSEIPSFRWWDRERRVLVQFGASSTFKKVADKYFRSCRPLTEDGACIAACYPGGAKEDFGIAYQDRDYSKDERSRSAWSVVLPYLAPNPSPRGCWGAAPRRDVGGAGNRFLFGAFAGQAPGPGLRDQRCTR